MNVWMHLFIRDFLKRTTVLVKTKNANILLIMVDEVDIGCVMHSSKIA